MKYVIIIPDGCADDPQELFDNQTPMQKAKLPNMDRLAQMGAVGRSNNVPKPLIPASDVATLSLFGYPPLEVYTGRAPLETAAMGIDLGPEDWAIRCNLIHVEDGILRDFTAGHIDNDTGSALIGSLQESLGGPVEGGRLEFHAGVSYRNILVFRADEKAPFSSETKTQAPHDVPDQPTAEHLPVGPGSEILRHVMQHSQKIFANHPANQARQQAGKKTASQVWLWGQGRRPSLKLFSERFNRKGAIISAVDLVRGVGILLGWKRIDVEGATGYLDTDYDAKAAAAIEALPEHDLVCVHVEAPDEASHEGLPEEKVKALERIDEAIVGPLMKELPKHGDWRMLVSPDHRTTLSTRAHAYGAVPFVIAGTGIESKNQASYDEVVAAESELAFEKGHELMPWFLA